MSSSFSLLDENPIKEYLKENEGILYREITNIVKLGEYTSKYNEEKICDPFTGEKIGMFPCRYDVSVPEVKFTTTKNRNIITKVTKGDSVRNYIINFFEEIYVPFLLFFKKKKEQPIGSKVVDIIFDEKPIN